MQVDGAEEELPDELENACSDDSKTLQDTPTQRNLLGLTPHSCRFALTSDLSCPVLSSDDSDCSSSSTASIVLHSG